MSKISPYAKSIVAALVAGLGSIYQALDGDQSITTQEWIAVAMTTLTALGVVFAVPNKDPEAEHQDESVQPPAEQRILGKALYNPESPTVEQPGGMRARPVDPGDHDA